MTKRARFIPLAALSLLGMADTRGQQTTSTGSVSVPTATAIPLSRRTPSGVTAQQTARPSGSTVDVMTPSIQVQGGYSESVPDPGSGLAITLALPEAIRRGLYCNLGVVSASAAERQRWLTNIVLDSATSVAKVFWPDVNHTVFHGQD